MKNEHLVAAPSSLVVARCNFSGWRKAAVQTLTTHAVDMESYGFYYACLHTSVVRPDFICIKGVADHCNGEKDSKWHAPCSLLSASVTLDILRNHYDFQD
jgi:nucleoside phosphorylase